MESFLFSIAQDVLKQAASLAAREVSMAWRFKGDLQRLQDTLSTVNAVVIDGENQQAKNEQLKVWLGNLKDVLYSAEDVFDEFQIYLKQQQQMRRRRSKSKVSYIRKYFSKSGPLAFSFHMAHKIKEVRERLDEIAVDKNNFGLAALSPVVREVPKGRDTYSTIDSEVIGREQDKEEVVDFLLNPCDDVLPVIPIVGIGGLGKTTLAKTVYNDERVVNHFELRIWVCVSEDFNLASLVKRILGSAAGGTCDSSSLEQLQTLLKNTLKDKRFLLTLDDVWNEERSKWNELRSLLIGGAQGSRIVVTTRKQIIASLMGTVPSHELKGLSHEQCLSLLVKWAFEEGQDSRYPYLVKVGEEIVKKCKGVPLAVKTLGGLLYMRTDEKYWKEVQNNDIWKLEQKDSDVLPALKLSYDEFSFDLKRCFASCCMFPKDSQLSSYEIIQFWIVQGLIQPLDDKKELEETGLHYINYLCSISFMQEDFVIAQFPAILKIYTMHDLVHDLASSVSTEFAVVSSNAQSISKRVHHISLTSFDLSNMGIPSSVVKLKRLRTIMNFKASITSLVEKCISSFRYLRFLDMNYSDFEVLPDSIGNLKHLRHLDLSSNKKLKRLPNSICKLLNLQTLNVSGCEELEELPSDIGNLISLLHLSMSTKQKLLPEQGIRGLASLRCLDISNCENLESLSEGIKNLTALRTLFINECPRLTSLPSSIKYLTSLENLVLWNCKRLYLTEWEGNEGLTSLRLLWVDDLPKMVALPEWLQGAANTIEELFMEKCKNLKALPEWLGNLTKLQKLRINECKKLSVLPEGVRYLTALQELQVMDCEELSKRCQREMGEDWHKIAHVPIIKLGYAYDDNDDDGGRLSYVQLSVTVAMLNYAAKEKGVALPWANSLFQVDAAEAATDAEHNERVAGDVSEPAALWTSFARAFGVALPGVNAADAIDVESYEWIKRDVIEYVAFMNSLARKLGIAPPGDGATTSAGCADVVDLAYVKENVVPFGKMCKSIARKLELVKQRTTSELQADGVVYDDIEVKQYLEFCQNLQFAYEHSSSSVGSSQEEEDTTAAREEEVADVTKPRDSKYYSRWMKTYCCYNTTQ